MDPERHPTLTESGVHLSVIVPTLNEAERLPRLLTELRELGPDVELVVSDGGSTDATLDHARTAADHCVEGPPGRGGQMNRGAAAATAPLLFFLHADSRFDRSASQALRSWMTNPRSNQEAAVFRFALDAAGLGWRTLEWGQAWRQRLAGIAFGDQGLVVPRSIFEATGGYPELPIMEDAALMKVLRRSVAVHTLPAALLTSPRRYRRQGRVRSVVRNQLLLALYTLGVNPRRLAGSYRPEPVLRPKANGPLGDAPPDNPSSEGTLVVFAKAPEPGRVKTRLAAEIGEEEAAAFYRVMGGRVVEQVQSDRYKVVVCFDPPTAEASMRTWLGAEIEYQAQAPGDLGRRMDAAFAEALEDGLPACIIGTDAPDVDAELIGIAFAALLEHDVVLGPADDGGYYLIGLNHPQSLLFRDVPWSTNRVLTATLEAAAQARLRVHLLPTYADVDRLADVPASLRDALGQ